MAERLKAQGQQDRMEADHRFWSIWQLNLKFDYGFTFESNEELNNNRNNDCKLLTTAM